MKSILIIQTASIGDVILATPVLENLHRVYPDAQIDFLLKKGNQSLFEGHPYLHKILIWDKSDRKYKNLLQLLFHIRKKQYDLIVNIQRFLATGILTAFSHSSNKVGFKKNPFSFLFTRSVKHLIGKDVHEVDRNLSLIACWVENPERNVKLYPSKKDDALVSQYKTRQYITVSPASLWFTKQFPKEKWIDFLQKIPDDILVYFLGGKGDEALCKELIKAVDSLNMVNLAGKLSLLQSASLMQHAQMNYVNDSAPIHLCSAVNAPVVALFCSTVPSFGFGPLSSVSYIIEGEELLGCRPCGLHGFVSCPEKHFKCGYNINTQELLKHLPHGK